MTKPENSTTLSSDSGDITLNDVLFKIRSFRHYLVGRIYLLISSIVFGGIIGFFYANFLKPTYTATTTFVLENSEMKGLSQYAGMAAMVGVDLGGSSGSGGIFQGDNILELYRSRTMLEKSLLSAINRDSKVLLIDRYILSNELDQGWDNRSDLRGLDFSAEPDQLSSASLRARDSLITEIVSKIRKQMLKVEKVDKKLSIIKVEVTSPDEEFSKVFNETLVAHVNEFYTQTKTARSAKNIIVLQNKVDSVRSAMTNAIYSAASVFDSTPNLNPIRQTQRTAPSQQAQFSAESNRLILSQLVQNLELTKMTLLKEEPLIQVVDYPVYPLYKEQVGKIKSAVLGAFVSLFVLLLVLSSKFMLNRITS